MRIIGQIEYRIMSEISQLVARVNLVSGRWAENEIHEGN